MSHWGRFFLRQSVAFGTDLCKTKVEIKECKEGIYYSQRIIKKKDYKKLCKKNNSKYN